MNGWQIGRVIQNYVETYHIRKPLFIMLTKTSRIKSCCVRDRKDTKQGKYMRKQVSKKIWKLASTTEQKSSLVKTSEGAVKWEGFARIYKDMKKAYKAGRGKI